MKSRMKVIVITGATRGLGRSLLDPFTRLGHTVLGCGTRPELIEKLQRAYPSPHDFGIVDVSLWKQVEAWAKRAIATYGAPDLLVNNAAVMNRLAPLWEIAAEEFDRMIDVNIKGVANVVRAFVPAMAARKTGVIVNLSSGWGRSTSPEVAPYCTTKWAVEGLTRALAQELPSGMAAVPLNPGVIDTDMLRSCWGDSASSYPSAEQWSVRAAPFLLQLGPKDNGKPLSV